jgi:hypothetical protein
MISQHQILMSSCKPYGEYFSKKVKDFFDEGDKVTVYSHHSYRLFAVGKNDKIFKIHHVDFGTTFFTKEEWRNKKINKILK